MYSSASESDNEEYESTYTETRTDKELADSHKGVAGVFSELYKSGELTDFTIVCGPHVFKVHKAIIAAHSAYFKVACSSDKFKEGEEHSITLKALEHNHDPECDEPEAIKLMVFYFYNLNYSGIDENEGDNLAIHARVFAAAVKYQVPMLRTLAARKFYECRNSTRAGIWAVAAEVVYTTTPSQIRDLRDITVGCISESRFFFNCSIIREVVKRNSELCFDLLYNSNIGPRAFPLKRTRNELAGRRGVSPESNRFPGRSLT